MISVFLYEVICLKLSLYYVVLNVLSHLLTVPAKFSSFWSCGIRALLR